MLFFLWRKSLSRSCYLAPRAADDAYFTRRERCANNPGLLPQVGSTGQDVASSLTADSGTSGGDVVVCGSTTGGLFEDPGVSFEGGSAAEVEGPADKGTEAFCAKLAALDGHVRVFSVL